MISSTHEEKEKKDFKKRVFRKENGRKKTRKLLTVKNDWNELFIIKYWGTSVKG